MRPFEYVRAADTASALAAMSATPNAKFLAGGSNLVDLMKEDVERPTRLVDITRLPLREIQRTRLGLSIGALATNTDTANHPLVRENYPLLTQAIVAGASGQLRNMATNGGNLLQRMRRRPADQASSCPMPRSWPLACHRGLEIAETPAHLAAEPHSPSIERQHHRKT